MEFSSLSSLGHFPRRFSCPTGDADQRLAAARKFLLKNEHTTRNIPVAHDGSATMCSETTASQEHILKNSSSKENTAHNKTSLCRHMFTKEPSALIACQSKSQGVGKDFLDPSSEHYLKSTRWPHFAKNEAEIIDDFPVNLRRGSLPILSSSDGLKVSFAGPGVSGIGRRRGSTSDSIDREIRSLRKNSIEEKRFLRACGELDKQSFLGALELKNKMKEVSTEHKKVLQRSPSADAWLLLNKSRKETIQGRERGDIARRYSRRERHFRAPRHLQDEVSKIRSHVLLEAGLLSGLDSDGTGEEEPIPVIAALLMSRRHTIPGDIQKTTESGSSDTRDMNVASIKLIQGILLEHKNRFYIEDKFVKEMIGSESNRKIEMSRSETDNKENTIKHGQSEIVTGIATTINSQSDAGTGTATTTNSQSDAGTGIATATNSQSNAGTGITKTKHSQSKAATGLSTTKKPQTRNKRADSTRKENDSAF